MTMKTIFIIILIFVSIFAFGQKNLNDSLCQDIYNQILREDSINNWKINRLNATINWTMIDTIYFEPFCCGPSITRWDLEKIDSVKLTIRFEKGWNNFKINSIKKTNKEIINVLKTEAIRYCDSIGWRIKINKASFEVYPYTYEILKGHPRFRKKGKFDIINVVRLPDTTINDIGIFIDLSFNYGWYTIYQERSNQKLLSILKLISFEILRKKKLIAGRFEYE
jgi:hypothetical protein